MRGVTKCYGDGPPVLDSINLSARAGEVLSLIGPSGCGKSTLLRLIAGLIPLTRGTLEIASHAEVGFIFQEPTLLPWLNVADNVALPRKLKSAPRGTTRATPPSTAPILPSTDTRELLARVKLSARARAYPHELSGGQKMRVSIARALTLNPQLLLLDEPFGALDEMTREHLQEELLALHAAQAWCAIFVTHSVAEAVFLSDRVFVMSAAPGRLAHEVAINLPRLRNADTRLSPAYQAQVTHVSRLLRSVEQQA
ncbi:nitrate/sulfonate/bicarbonate ABC transporter ATP-binding protein [Cephaloticoccus primus]|uniref:Nitrate/sulfonate/bicarbonate ABC transporter ATP-binding protein n=1 Tax=Cephaloticoccus primus TaxID=1548207 RepID=A0A139SLM4_9BACT|nr:nitrate/sulfonate/bicarbonate ABC transporter ATP-binding protein [Cephaloticoccus primus]